MRSALHAHILTQVGIQKRIISEVKVMLNYESTCTVHKHSTQTYIFSYSSNKSASDAIDKNTMFYYTAMHVYR